MSGFGGVAEFGSKITRKLSNLLHILSKVFGHFGCLHDWVDSVHCPHPRSGCPEVVPIRQSRRVSRNAVVALGHLLAKEPNLLCQTCAPIIWSEKGNHLRSPRRRRCRSEWPESDEQVYEKRRKMPVGCSRRQRKPVPEHPRSDGAERATTFFG